MQVKIVRGQSKKGNQWEALQISVGEYKSPLIFPTKIEMMYIKDYMRDKAHKDFKGDDLDADEADSDSE
ncbi:hypothetical protein IJJ39_01440 [Candidatus Saccharibacteria bacterium]|nr:hypothetical protein [Candidatus Saccharibacteria bacterium]